MIVPKSGAKFYAITRAGKKQLASEAEC